MMSSSTKVIKKLKLGIHGGFEKLPDCRMDESEEKLEYLMQHLTPTMEEEARLQLKETDEIRAKALEDLRQLLKREKHLVCPMEDAFLLQFLRSRKFSVKKAFKLLQNYWVFRRDHSSIFDTSRESADRVQEVILKNIIGFLPYRDRKGSLVLIFKVGLWNPEIDTYEEMFQTISAILIHSIQFPATQVCGYRVIFDARGLSWSQMKMCTPSNILLLIHSTQYCFPARYKGFHFLSENKMFNLAWSIICPLLTTKLRRRIMLHGSDLKPLLDYIHPSVLPREYGGDATFDNIIWTEIIEANVENVLSQLNYGYKN